jgi:hypothetical protein
VTSLARLNLLLFALLIAHTVDHAVNQPARDLPATGTLVGVAGFALVAASSVVALRRSPAAPVASVVAGGLTALGIVAIHLAPAWWDAVSDPYWDFSANAVSWLLALAPLVCGVALAAAGAAQLRSARPTASPA